MSVTAPSRSKPGSPGQDASIGRCLARHALVVRKLKVAYKALMNVVVDYSVTHPDLQIQSATASELDGLKGHRAACLLDTTSAEFQIIYSTSKIHGLPNIIKHIEDSVSLATSPRAAFNAMLGFARLCHVMFRVRERGDFYNPLANPLWFRRCIIPEVDEALLKLTIKLWKHEGRMTDFRSAATILELSQHFSDRRFHGEHYFCLRALRFMHIAPRVTISSMMRQWLLNKLPVELAIMVLDYLQPDSLTRFSEDQETLQGLMKPLALPPIQDCEDKRCMRELTARSRSCPNKMFLLAVKDTNNYFVLHPSTPSKSVRGKDSWGGSSICPHRPCPWHHE